MNTLIYEGKLKKKYTPNDVIKIVKNFAKDKNLELEQRGDTLIIKIIDDGISCLYFTFENNCLIKQIVQHDIDEDKKYAYIYELLYLIKSYFSTLEVNDEFGAWADYCYYRNPKKIMIRELKDDEKMLLDRIDDKNCEFPALQSMWGVIALYLAEQKIYDEEGALDRVNWDFIRRRINPSCGVFCPIWISSAVETWMDECMMYKKGKKSINIYDDDKLRNKIDAICWGFCDVIFECYGGTTNAHQSVIKKNYEYFKNKLNREGIDISKDKYLTFRVMISTLEYFGFYITAPYPTKIKSINAADISYWDTV